MKDRILWLLLIFAAVYILGNIGTGSLTTWDEAVYANISGTILKTGDWVVMHDGGRPWFDKPPLYMWCTAISYKIFGVSEFSVRLTSALFGVATVLLIYLFVKRLYDQRAALLSALLLLASPHYIHFSKMGMMDVMLTFFVTSTIFFFWLGQEKPIFLFWSGVTILFAYFTKGFAAISAPAIIFFYCLFSG
ncbi:MAG: glycosyltransferase family 39 protein, partial [Candidatus Omnitrophica bacterium]|nr:glycosyltransferase family 39 protein [Candidatus Omnitrophota bacterium]